MKKPFLSLHKVFVTSAVLQKGAGEKVPRLIEKTIVFYHKKQNKVLFLFLTWCFSATVTPLWLSMYSWFICECKCYMVEKSLQK